MLEALPQTDFTKVLVTLWAIWHVRRKAIHEQISQSPHSTHHFIHSYIRELELCRPKKPSSASSSNTTVGRTDGLHRRQVHARSKWTVLCLDRRQKAHIYSVVCRDEEGKYLGSSAIKCTCILDPASLEAMACREALSLAIDLGIAHVIVASDCQEVVNNLNKDTGGLYASIIKEIRATSAQLQQCSFTFKGRESNREVLSLAKHTLGLPLGRHVWLLNPPDISCIWTLINKDEYV